MTESENLKRVLASDLVNANDRVSEIEELIIELAPENRQTSVAILLEGLKSEYELFFELLTRLKPAGIESAMQAIFFLHDLQQAEKESDNQSKKI